MTAQPTTTTSSTAKPVIGIDLGGTHMQIGVVDTATHRIIGRARANTLAREGRDAVIERMCEGISEACRAASIRVPDLQGVGIGAPSPIDAAHETVINAVNLRWTNVPLASLVSKKLGGVPVTLDNDVNVAVWGEYRLGAASSGFANVLGVWVGTGIGGGLVINGQLHGGTFGTAGEIGQTIFLPNGGPGSSTLEHHGARTAIVNRMKQLILANHPSVVMDMLGGDIESLTISEVAKAVQQNDRLALEVAGHSASVVGIASANAATLLSLDCVVLGGGAVESLGDWYVRLVRQHFDQVVFPDTLQKCAIVPTKLSANAGLLGAALLAEDRCRR